MWMWKFTTRKDANFTSARTDMIGKTSSALCDAAILGLVRHTRNTHMFITEHTNNPTL